MKFWLMLAAIAAPLAAGEPSRAGHYTLDAKGSDDIDRAIERTVAPMSFITRPIARRRLRETNDGYSAITLAFPKGQISVQFENAKPVVVPATGEKVKWTDEDGERFDVSARLERGVLEQVFVAADGVRTNAYTWSEDGSTMTMNVTVTASRLPRPLTYKLVFRRGASTPPPGPRP